MADFFQDETEIPSSLSTTATISTLFESCPLCKRVQKSFTCESCVTRGKFSHSRKKYSEHSYCEMLTRFENLKRLKIAFQNRVVEILEKRRSLDKLADEVLMKRNQIQCLQQVLHSLQDDVNLDVLQLNSIRDTNSQKMVQMTISQEKTKKLAELRDQYQAKLVENKQGLTDVHYKLCEQRKISVNRIQHYLFPIESIPVYPVMGTPPPYDKSDDLDMTKDIEVDDDIADESVESALAEATRTSYVKGQWISRVEEVQIEYSIVDGSCVLNSNGDYSAYCDWVKAHRNGSRGPDEEIGLRNPAFTICAGLTHTAQFLELLAYYFDVILPKRLSYSEFCHNELNKGEFKSAVCRLNANILHLCFTQHVDPTLLHADRTLHNLYALLNSTSIGRAGPFECHPELLLTSTDQDNEDESDFESDVEENANSESDTDWETLPKSLDIPEDSTIDSTMDNSMILGNIIGEHDNDNPAIASSLVSSAAASVAALWPWKR